MGAVSFGCLARDGHHVIGVDLDPSKLSLLRDGQSPIVERGMPELIAAAAESGRTQLTGDAASAVRDSTLSLVCVGTPSLKNGRHDLSSIEKVCKEIGAALAKKGEYHTVVIRSTIPPGTAEEIVRPTIEAASMLAVDKDFSLCFQPEFLREGTSIEDYDNPPYTVVAGSKQGVDQLRELYGHLPCDFIETTVRTAEMVKFCCNAFHATKVTFANEVGRLCQKNQIDGRQVMDLLCRDRQLNISRAYMKPGFAFGGSCLPKDLRAITTMGADDGISVPMMTGINVSNQLHIQHAVDLVLESNVRKIGLIGLSFKHGTDDLRESPLLELAERLIGKGISLKIYDPEVNISRIVGANKKFVEESLPHVASLMVEDPKQIFLDTDAIVVGVKNTECISVWRNKSRRDLTVIDLVGIDELKNGSDHYIGICW